MRRIVAASLIAMGLVVMGGMLAGAPAQAFLDTVPPFKGNDTGGIIAYSGRCARFTERVRVLIFRLDMFSPREACVHFARRR